MADREKTTGERSSVEIRREIERTRHQMDETVERIGDKLSAARILDEMWKRFRAGDGPAMLGEAIRDHPRPFALMGLGIGLLAVEQTRARDRGKGHRHDHVGSGTTERAEGRVGPYRGEAVDRDDPDWEHVSVGTKVKSRIEDAASSLKHAASSVRERAHTLSEKAQEAGHRLSETGQRIGHAGHSAEERIAQAGHTMADRASELAETARERARAGTDRARQGVSTFFDESPLALGAIALGLGIAAGLGAPSTRWEDERVGRQARALKQQARELATETAGKVKHVAEDATRAAREELQRQREETGPIEVAINQLRQSAKEIGNAAREAARQRAESESLTVEGLKSRTRRSGRRARATSEADSTD
jgi:hypothetical protein